MRTCLSVAILLLAPATGIAHRLDEYLQATILSIGKDRLQAEMTLTPGVAVFPVVLAEIDADADGVVSETEWRAYAGRVLRDLSLTVDGHSVIPRMVSARFPGIDEMKEGRGEIRIEFQANLPRGRRSRSLVFENRHQSRLGAYLVNCLVPRDPDIRIVAQTRNYSQSRYQLDYVQAGASTWRPGDGAGLGLLALVLCTRLAFLWRRRPVTGT
ncbi:MAG TPA: hypothetical protein VMH28_29745 [Candidatus Acidoferrales bacterium]|nr:hypothetical protein [Candidatus Acidoferrales bacterium]